MPASAQRRTPLYSGVQYSVADMTALDRAPHAVGWGGFFKSLFTIYTRPRIDRKQALRQAA